MTSNGVIIVIKVGVVVGMIHVINLLPLRNGQDGTTVVVNMMPICISKIEFFVLRITNPSYSFFTTFFLFLLWYLIIKFYFNSILSIHIHIYVCVCVCVSIRVHEDTESFVVRVRPVRVAASR